MWCLVPGAMSLSSVRAHLVIHCESNLMHCLDEYLGPHIPGGMGGPRGNGFRVVP